MTDLFSEGGPGVYANVDDKDSGRCGNVGMRFIK